MSAHDPAAVNQAFQDAAELDAYLGALDTLCSGSKDGPQTPLSYDDLHALIVPARCRLQRVLDALG